MKFTPALCLLLLVYSAGCGRNPDGSPNGTTVGPKNAERADKSSATDHTASSPVSVASGNGEAAPTNTLRQSTPLPGTDAAAEALEDAQPISWFQRVRYWDVANRVVAGRSKIPAKFDDKSAREFAQATKRIASFHKQMFRLQRTLLWRTYLAESQFFRKEILASLRGETSLPEGTRDRHKKLPTHEDLSAIEEQYYALEEIERRLVRDEVTMGDLLQLALELRESLMAFKTLRQHEIALDEYFLSFPWMDPNHDERSEIWGWYPEIDKTTVRELWTESPPDWFKERCRRLHKAYRESTLKDAQPEVLSDNEFEELVILADRLEEMSGGGAPNLLFPEIGNLPSRERLAEAFRLNLEAILKADTEALKELRRSAYDRLDEEDKAQIDAEKVRKSPWLDLINVRGNEASDFDAAWAVGHAVETKLGSSLFYEWNMPDWAIDDYAEFVVKRRREVFDVGARYYFRKPK